jgi:integral membrane protein
MLSSVIGRLRVIGFLEGLSFLILLGIAMPLKYKLGMPQAVRIVGMAHGVLFIAFIAASVQATVVYRWSVIRMFLLWLSSLVPFGTFYADYKLLRGEGSRSETA